MKRFLLWLILNRRERTMLKDGLHERYGAYMRKLDLPSNRSIQDEIEGELIDTSNLRARLFSGD